MYSYHEVMTFIEEEDVKFIRLAFCDIHGRQKNLAVMPSEVKRAFERGVAIDASSVAGFGGGVCSDLLLFPDPSTLSVLPWRPSSGRVVRMFCDIRRPDGTPFERDGRVILRNAVAAAAEMGISCRFGAEFEFYLFRTDEKGNPTDEPFDRAGYMDIAPYDKGENVRREICFTLLDMGITPESSHHEVGPGQNEIDFKPNSPLEAANDAVTFKSVVETVARQNGLAASFAPKPLKNEGGNGMHIHVSVSSENGGDPSEAFLAGILAHIGEITAFLNPLQESYQRLGGYKAPRYISWSRENRSQLIRIPPANGDAQRIVLRSPDPAANPYIAYACILYAGLDGVKRGLKPPAPLDLDLASAPTEVLKTLEKLPDDLYAAKEKARHSAFVRAILPEGYVDLL